ncbi:hypothetical protein [Sphingomonas sp. Leaf23]|uniref:hypothetical protein n=1 Tax=Sphingomonas sp. Leaf23 TaxID=1735689 RepID=UPI00190FCE8B|nr:hypothetical protein [Sphingomonas sp. Leaf23]
MLAGVDGRSAVARRYREIVETLRADMGGDPSEAQEQIARRAASLAIWCEQQDEGAANGKPIDVAAYTTAANSLRRLLESLGLKRAMRNVTPSIAEYGAQAAARRAVA